MPTYEYECTSCGSHFEIFQKMSDAPKETCESCGGKLTKLLSAGSGLIFKGSGFYITDYKSKSGGESSASDSSPKSDAGAAKSDSKVDSSSKTEAKSTSTPAKTE